MNDRWVSGGKGRVTSGLTSDSPLVCSGDGQVHRWGLVGLGMDYDVCRGR